MKYAKIFTLSSALIVAASVFGASAEARKSDSDQCTASGLNKAECACVMALEKGTKKALRDYLKLYRTADTACNARASTAITENSNEGEPDSSSTTTSTVASTKNNNGLGNGDEGDCQGGGCGDTDNPGHNDSGGNDSGGNGNGGNGNGNGGKH